MHDAAHFESVGIPSVAVISSEFKPQAAYQARMLGLEEVRAEFVQHPISDATLEMMEQKAVGAFPGVVQALTTGSGSALSKVSDLAAPSACDS
mmetsp:Transcript_16506/g.34892  ORF Transcript_16506/g.34892 Transcript_16506/m.34892 type:complete len:93 (+) Transcript_16506:184-462(+)